MKNNNLLDKFTQVMADTLLEVGKEPGWYLWPMPIFHPAEGNFYLCAPDNSFLVQLYSLIEELRNRGLKDKDIALLFKKPSRIAALTFLFDGIRWSKLTKEKRVKLAIDLLSFIAFFRKDDPFCEGSKNILWENKEVRANLEKVNLLHLSEFSEADAKRMRRLIGEINASLFILCEYLYFNHHFIGHEFHGPYKLEDNSLLVIREYYDLKNEVWGFSKELPTDSVVSFEIYKKDTDIKFDFFNRIRSTSPLPQKLISFRIKTGGLFGKELDEKEMKDLSLSIQRVNENACKVVTKLTKGQLLERYVETKYFVLKPLAEKLGKDWRPSTEIYQFIKEVSPPEDVKEIFKRIAELSIDEQKKIIRTVFDPRIDELPFQRGK